MFNYCHAQAARKHRRKGDYVVFAFTSVHGRAVYKWMQAE